MHRNIISAAVGIIAGLWITRDVPHSTLGFIVAAALMGGVCRFLWWLVEDDGIFS